MPKLTINGTEVEVEQGTSIIQGLIRHFRPEMEKRIMEYRKTAPRENAA